MQVVRFRCPHCAADLRVRDEEFLGRPIGCPSCFKKILISRGPNGEFTVAEPNRPASAGQHPYPDGRSSEPSARPLAAATAAGPAAKDVAPPAGAAAARRWTVPAWLAGLSPVAIAWIAGGSLTAIAVGVLVLMAARGTPPARTKPADTAAAVVADPKPDKADPARPGEMQRNGTKPFAPGARAQSNARAATAEGRLQRLGELLTGYRVSRGHFPAGTVSGNLGPASERWSWLAEIAAASLFNDRAPPNWHESWKSPSNERFVRQRVPEFLNPSVTTLIGQQSYPATHFVGIAGVGRDAADLPVDHPRAGVFGTERTTRLEDIRDGASNTMMVSGVTNELGSWAAGGPSTVRPLTQPPYVNGPDGFGTGQLERMAVLMADGSVREVSSSTSPLIVRRMAAMADGRPLDVNVPGEPGEPSVRPKEPSIVDGSPQRIAQRAPVSAPRPMPGSDGAAPAHKNSTVDVAACLNQRILRFEQQKPALLRDVLAVIEEMLSVPIRSDKAEIADLDDLMQTPITFDLRNTTVGGILKAVLAKVKLTFEIESDAVRLRKFATAPIDGGLH